LPGWYVVTAIGVVIGMLVTFKVLEVIL